MKSFSSKIILISLLILVSFSFEVPEGSLTKVLTVDNFDQLIMD